MLEPFIFHLSAVGLFTAKRTKPCLGVVQRSPLMLQLGLPLAIVLILRAILKFCLFVFVKTSCLFVFLD